MYTYLKNGNMLTSTSFEIDRLMMGFDRLLAPELDLDPHVLITNLRYSCSLCRLSSTTCVLCSNEYGMVYISIWHETYFVAYGLFWWKIKRGHFRKVLLELPMKITKFCIPAIDIPLHSFHTHKHLVGYS